MIRGKRFNLQPGEIVPTYKGELTNWKFIKDAPVKQYKDGKHRMLLVQCTCGTIVENRVSNIRSGHSTRCGKGSCKKPRLGNKSINTPYYHLYKNYYNAAIKRGLSFELTLEQFKVLTVKNCFYCGRAPFQKLALKYCKTGEKRSLEIIYNGVDRIDNKQGYVENNCTSCCGQCNRAKLHYSKEEFLLWISLIHNHLNLK